MNSTTLSVLALALLPAAALPPGSAPVEAVPSAPVRESAGFAAAVAQAESALERGDLIGAKVWVRRALERDPKSRKAWDLRARLASAKEDLAEEVYCLHKIYRLAIAQGASKRELRDMEARLVEVDPIAPDLLSLKKVFITKLEPIATRYEKDDRPHAAIEVHRQILALDPERTESQEAIERIASQPDPSLAENAKPKDLLADISEEFIREHDEETREWSDRAKLQGENYTTYTNAGYEVLVRASEAMDQMNAFYREFFRYGTKEYPGNVSRIDLNIFRHREEYLKKGIGPPVEWSGGHFTGNAVETYISGSFQGTVGTLFHEAAHQFVDLATSASGWLNEGLASFFEGCQILPNGTVLMNLPANHRLFPLVGRMRQGWMTDHNDGINPEDPSKSRPTRAPTFRIVLENQYQWGPPWYAPTWGVVYFLYNYQDPADGRFIYRRAFQEFIDKSGGRVGSGAVRNFEDVVLANPAEPTKGVKTSTLELPETIDELDPIWRDFLFELAENQSGSKAAERPYAEWADYAITRKEYVVAKEHFEKGLVAEPDNVEMLLGFADLLAEEFDNEDRATKLVLQAIRLMEAAPEPDERALDRAEDLLEDWDPDRKGLRKVQEELWAAGRNLVQRYSSAEMTQMAMELSWRFGSELEVPGILQYYERALREGAPSPHIWRLAYNEENLDGWSPSTAGVWQANGQALSSEFGRYTENANNLGYSFLTLDTITSGDFAMEVEVLAQEGQNTFCGIVFGNKGGGNFHGLVYHAPKPDDGSGRARSGFFDLSSFYGAGNPEIWRHLPVATLEEIGGSTAGEWRKLRIEITGTTVDAYFDDEFMLTHRFPSLDVLRGGFGLLTGPGKAQYRNVRFLARAADDPGGVIERSIRMEGVEDSEGSVGGSWLGKVPPFPKVERWVQGERKSWTEVGARPQLLVLWSINQNELIPLHYWLQWLQEKQAHIGLEIVCVADANDQEQLEAYLAHTPLPGAVGVDNWGGTESGETFTDYAIARFHLPRLILLDIDGTVFWEGDPGFKMGIGWNPPEESYLATPLRDLAAQRNLEALGAWREEWTAKAVPAMNSGDLQTALAIMNDAAEFDERGDGDVFDAKGRLTALVGALGSLDSTADSMARDGRDPAFEILLDWAPLLDVELESRDVRRLRSVTRSEIADDWEEVLENLDGFGKMERRNGFESAAQWALEELGRRAGAFPRELADDLRLALEAGDPERWNALLAEAETRPLLWLAREYFRW